ncbi:hypothetical protein SARC_02605 [Sphaeroforma arctica JP610]|uniref:Ricin B lectin domain-containing protein n=1 Tax=Sphaeroforma arctica JP610 TaxID=667725 RepID=A0A0L0G857_9EUKA|nr:hypothetical protein SARC_02605 [Sphaeroforma arctica JP610]KNC85185.1 hypothetical protein SARC_02605 [Sphaeroforma arctica JP610]|eukprot:XP_014159087.1 hypothetical protein SARC_02605 [Sphaeroforma arctica JP610]
MRGFAFTVSLILAASISFVAAQDNEQQIIPAFQSVSLDNDPYENYVMRQNRTANCIGVGDIDTSDPYPIIEPCTADLSQVWLRIADFENQGQWQNRVTQTCITVPYNGDQVILKTCSATTLNNQKILDDALIAPRPNTATNVCLGPCADASGRLCTFEAGTVDWCAVPDTNEPAFNYELYAEEFCQSPISEGRWEIDFYGECSTTCDTGLRPVTYVCSSLRDLEYSCCGDLPENEVPCNSVPCGASVSNYKVIKSTASLDSPDATPLCIDAIDPTHVEMRPCAGSDSQLFIQINPKDDKQWVNKATGNCIQVPERYNMDKQTDFIFLRPCQDDYSDSDNFRYQQFAVDELVETRVRTCLTPCDSLADGTLFEPSLDDLLIAGRQEEEAFFNPAADNKDAVCAVRDNDNNVTPWCQAGSFSYLGLDLYNRRMEDQLWCQQEESAGSWQYFGEDQCSAQCDGGIQRFDYRCIPEDPNVETACCGTKPGESSRLCNAQPCDATLDDTWVLEDLRDRGRCATTQDDNTLTFSDCLSGAETQRFLWLEQPRSGSSETQQWFQPSTQLCVTVLWDREGGLDQEAEVRMSNCSITPDDMQFFHKPSYLINTAIAACLAPCTEDEDKVCAFGQEGSDWCTADVSTPKNTYMKGFKYCLQDGIDCPVDSGLVTVTQFTTVEGPEPTFASTTTSTILVTSTEGGSSAAVSTSTSVQLTTVTQDVTVSEVTTSTQEVTITTEDVTTTTEALVPVTSTSEVVFPVFSTSDVVTTSLGATTFNPFGDATTGVTTGDTIAGDDTDATTGDGVDGNWSEWAECTVTCSFGIQTRECNNPAASGGGAECPGAAIRTCNPGPCARALDMRSVDEGEVRFAESEEYKVKFNSGEGNVGNMNTKASQRRSAKLGTGQDTGRS